MARSTLLGILTAFILSACSGLRETAVESHDSTAVRVIRDTVTVTKMAVVTDTTAVYDSVFIDYKIGSWNDAVRVDTIEKYREKTVYRDRLRLQVDTVYRAKDAEKSLATRDNTEKVVEKEKPLSLRQKVEMILGKVFVTILIVLFILYSSTISGQRFRGK